MKITKNLKYASFEWDDEEKTFSITEEDGNRVILNKVYSFAFMRFVIRMAQRNWYRKTENKAQKKQNPTELADHPFEDPSQVEFSFKEMIDEHREKLPF